MSLRLCRWQGGAGSLLLLLLVLGTLLSPGTKALASQAPTDRVSLDVVDADLVRVVDMLRSSIHANIIISKPDTIKAKVSATLHEVTLETALRAVVEGAGYTWWHADDGIYYINSEAPKKEVVAPAPTPAVVAAPKVIRMEKIKLRYVNPSVLVKQLNAAPGDPDPSMENMFNKPAAAPTGEPTIPVNTASDMNSTPGGYKVSELGQPGYNPPAPAVAPLGDSRSVNPLISGRTPQDGSELLQAGQRGGWGGGGFNRGRPQQAPNINGGVQGGNTNGTNAGQNKLMPDDIYLVMPYEIDNSLVVRGTDVAIDELKQVIRMLDIAPKQVQIKAEFVELTVSDENALGLDWSIQTLDSSVATTGMAPAGNISMRFASGNIQATLSALKSTGRAKVKNSPIISTMNNVSASINVGTQYVYFVSYTQTPTVGNTITNVNPVSMQVNTGLLVLPRVNGDGSITVSINPQVMDVIGSKRSPNGDEIPITTYRTLTTTRRVGDGDTIVIGGLNSAHDDNNEVGLPFLRDLPIVGGFFRSARNRTNESELLIFLTPTVLPEPVGSAGISSE